MAEEAILCPSCRWALARWVTTGADGSQTLVCSHCGRHHATRPRLDP